jgi:hypothetical protein
VTRRVKELSRAAKHGITGFGIVTPISAANRSAENNDQQKV